VRIHSVFHLVKANEGKTNTNCKIKGIKLLRGKTIMRPEPVRTEVSPIRTQLTLCDHYRTSVYTAVQNTNRTTETQSIDPTYRDPQIVIGPINTKPKIKHSKSNRRLKTQTHNSEPHTRKPSMVIRTSSSKCQFSREKF
jgi:hypothetical protein